MKYKQFQIQKSYLYRNKVRNAKINTARKIADSYRDAQPEKCEFTTVNDHFEGKHNADSGLYGQTLIRHFSEAYNTEKVKQEIMKYL